MTVTPEPDTSVTGRMRDGLAHSVGNVILETIGSKGYCHEFRSAIDYGMKAAMNPNLQWKPVPEFASFLGHQDKRRDKVAENMVVWLLLHVATEYYGKMVIGSLAYGMSAMVEDLIDGIDEIR